MLRKIGRIGAAATCLVLVAIVLSSLGSAASLAGDETSVSKSLGGLYATDAGGIATSEGHVLGEGAWKWEPRENAKFLFYVYWSGASTHNLGTFTINEIEDISYYTNKPGAESDPDFYLSIYTEPDGDNGWYGYRLNAEPYFSNELDAPPDQWNQWNTDEGANQLTFFDSDQLNDGFGFYGQPTLQDLQEGPINWSDYDSSYADEEIDYGEQQVKGIALSTGTGWSSTFEGAIDAFTISLTDGTKLTLDFENQVWVDHDFDDSTPGWQKDHFDSIQDGVNAVGAAGTVNVAAGTYEEHVSIDKALTLQGAGASETIVDVSGLSIKNPHVTIEIPDGVDNVTVDGFTLIGKPDSDYADDSVIRCGGSAGTNNNITISNNTIEGYKGVLFKNGSQLKLQQNDITFKKNGIVIQNGCTNVDIADNSIGGGSSLDNDPAGIYLTSTSGSITGNTIQDIDSSGDDRGKGMTGSSNHDLQIEGNTIQNTGYDGISFWGNTHHVTISRNILLNNAKTYSKGAGIHIKGDDIDIKNNTITGSGHDGIVIDVNTLATERVRISQNDLSANDGYALNVVDAGETVDASGNWWGSDDPATVSGSITGTVDFTPLVESGEDQDDTTAGFQPDLSSLTVHTLGEQTGTVDRIQEGIDLVDGSTVNMAAGGYTEDVSIGKPISLLGADASTTTIDGETLVSDADGVVIKNLTVTEGGIWFDSANDASVDNVAITDGSRGLTVEDSSHGTFTNVEVRNLTAGGDPVGVLVRSGGEHRFEDLTVDGATTSGSFARGLWVQSHNNAFVDTTIKSISAGASSAYGIYMVGAIGNQFDNTAIDNVVSGANGQAWGVLLQASSDNAFDTTSVTNLSAGHQVAGIAMLYAQSGNAFTNTVVENVGIHAGGPSATLAGGVMAQPQTGASSDHVFDGLSITGVSGQASTYVRGVYLKDTTDVQISDAVVDLTSVASVAEASGFRLIASDGTQVSNSGADNGQYGVYVDGGHATLVDGSFTANSTGVLVDNAGTAVVEYSRLVDNDSFGISNATGILLDGTPNWWGAASGPSGEGPGTGDPVSEHVDYSPWCGDAECTFFVSEGEDGEIVIPTDATSAEAQAIIDSAPEGATIIFEGGDYVGGYDVNTSDLTFNLNGSTIGAGSPAFTISAADVTVLGPGTLDGEGSGAPAILVKEGGDNFTLKDVEVTGWAAGVEVEADVTSFKIVGNWFHGNGTGLLIDDDVTLDGVVKIEGNLFKENSTFGIDHNGEGTLPATYNSWGDAAGPNGANGDGFDGIVTVEPWTFAEVFLDVDPDAEAIQRHVNEDDTFEVALKVEAAGLYAVEYTLTYSDTLLTLNGDPTAGDFVGDHGSCTVDTAGGGEVSVYCTRQTPDVDASGTLTVSTLSFTADLPDIAEDAAGPWTNHFDIAHAAADTNAGAQGGVKVYINNVGFGEPSDPARDITDTEDGRIDITGLANFTGFIALQGRTDDSGATINVYSESTIADATAWASGTSAGGGAYTTSYIGDYQLLVGETYHFQVNRDLFLPTTAVTTSHTYQGLPTDWQNDGELEHRPLTQLAMVQLLGGDASNDDLIDIDDAICIGSDYGGAPTDCGTGGSSDVNGDGTVDLLDLVLMAGNYDKTSSPWTQ